MENFTLNFTNATENTTVPFFGKTLQEYNDEEANRRLIPVIYLVLLMVIGIPGNIMVLIVFPFRFPPSTHRMFISTLAIADLLVCTISLPFEIIEMRFQYTFYVLWVCKLFRSSNNLFALSSIFILMGLSGDRYRRVCTPLKIQMTSHHARIFSISSVMLAFVFAWPNFLISGIRLVKLDAHTIGYDCSLSDEFAKTKYPTIYGGVLFLVFIICMVSLIVLYCLIGRKICVHFQFRRRFSKGSTSIPTSSTLVIHDDENPAQHTDHENHEQHTDQEYHNEVFEAKPQTEEKAKILPKKLTRASSKHHSKTKTAKEEATSKKLTKIAFAISLGFILSYLPHLTLSMLTALKGKFLFPPGPIVSAVLPIVSRSFAINNVINPVIYGFMDKRFRDCCKLIFKNLICCRR